MVSRAGYVESQPAAHCEVARDDLFAGLFVLGFANGLYERINLTIASDGLWPAVANTFGVSVIVWVAGWLAASLLREQAPAVPTRSDLIVAGAYTTLIVLPFGTLSWLALTGLGAYIFWHSVPGSARRRGAIVLVALTVPMFWSRMLFALFSDSILQADAILVSWMIGTEHIGNTVKFSDDWGFLYIAPACSSLANVSLSLLASVLVAQSIGSKLTLRQVAWCLIAAATVILVNVTRIGLIALHREYYELLHGSVGATVSGWLTLIAIAGVNWCGVRRVRLAHR